MVVSWWIVAFLHCVYSMAMGISNLADIGHNKAVLFYPSKNFTII